MKTPKFQIGDRVTIKNNNRNRVTGYQADLLANVGDGTITSQCRNEVEHAILAGKPFVISDIEKPMHEAEEPTYEVKRGKHRAPFVIYETELIPAK